ncbi:unnamed protein product [Caenorhabditis nigoni]
MRNFSYIGFRTSIGERSSQEVLLPLLSLPNEAEPILMEIFREKPKIPRLHKKTTLFYPKLKEFFNDRRRDDRIAGNFPLHEVEAQPILLDIFAKNPKFHDYKNIELKNKIHIF